MWKRTVAGLIDLACLFPIAVAENAAGVADQQATAWLNGAVWVAYFTLLDYRYGGTLGKLACGLRVAVEPWPHPTIIGLLVVRAVARLVVLFPPLLLVYGCLMIWASDGRTLTDLCSRSYVVEYPSLRTLPSMTRGRKIWSTVAVVLLVVLSPLLVMAALSGMMVLSLFVELLCEIVAEW